MTAIRKRSVRIAGHRTSVSVEDEFWENLKDIAKRDALSLDALIARIDEGRSTNLSSAVRLHVLRDLRNRLDEMNDRQSEPSTAASPPSLPQ